MEKRRRAIEQEYEDWDRAVNVLHWNEKLMSGLGLWPHRRNNVLFLFNYGYYCVFMVLEYLDLFLFIDNFEHVIMNLTESLQYSQIFVRVTMLWQYNDELGLIISEARKDFDASKYKTMEERKAFLAYNARSKLLVKLLTIFVTMIASSYYLTPTFLSLGSGLPQIKIGNKTETIYLLPYHLHVFYPVEDMQTYVVIYAFELPFAFISGFGHMASDCIMVTLVFHVCGQMSALALRINNINVDFCKCKDEVRNAVKIHSRLLCIGEKIEQTFSATLLANLIVVTTLLCILGYQILVNLDNGDKGILFTFVVYQFVLLLTLYAHCILGESLLTESLSVFYNCFSTFYKLMDSFFIKIALELLLKCDKVPANSKQRSTKVCDAFYDCQWYDMSTDNIKLILLCIVRSQKPLRLTAGKFNTFGLNTLTEVLKTSLGYLSVLRSLIS